MANVINRITLQYIKSVNTPDYDSADWVINPDMSLVAGIPEKYWRLVGDTPKEMTIAQKNAVDQAEADVLALQQENAKDFEISFDTLMKAFALVVLDEINILRSNASLADRTISQLKQAVKDKYDTL